MNTYVTGTTIKKLREKKGITQSQLAESIGVSSKAVSKWETAKGLPDISLIEPLSRMLGLSVTELLSGDLIINKNISSNLLRSKFYVCPVCGNIIHSTGEITLSCCGITLFAIDADETDEKHEINIKKVEDEFFVSIDHEMTKNHYISFIAHITTDTVHFVKLYPESNAETRLSLRGGGYLYICCNKHGLMKRKI